MPMNIFPQPIKNWVKVSAFNVVIDFWYVRLEFVPKLSGVEVAQSIGWKVANGSLGPVDVLKNTERVGWRSDAE